MQLFSGVKFQRNLFVFLLKNHAYQASIVTGEFIKDVIRQFLNNKIFIFDFVRLTNEKWDELIIKNEKLVEKHKEILSKFDIKDGK